MRLLPRLGASLLALQSSLVVLILLYALVRLPEYLKYSAQLRSASIASHLANRVQSELRDTALWDKVREEFALLESVNSEVRAFLLDREGRVLLTASSRPLKRRQVALSLVAPLLSSQIPTGIIYGEDPESLEQAIISVAPVVLGEGSGYIYLTIQPILFPYLETSDGIRSYLVLVLPLVVVVTIVSWWMMKLYTAYLLRQFKGLVDAARALAQGEREHRAPVESSDEIGRLAASFNATADAILLQEEEIVRSERSRRFLVAGVLHDLRAPLAAMRGMIELLGSASGDSEKRWGTVQSCVLRQRRFLESLEQLTEVELAAESFTFDSLDLDQLVSAIVELMAHRAKERGIELQYIPCPVPVIAGDSFWIGRAITNVLVNAINYTPRNGSVSVALSEVEGSIQCAIRDSGIGISPEDTERIFEQFYRASAVVAAGTEGSGLGLAVVKKVIERHHGSVSVESELKKGTTFYLRLPSKALLESVPFVDRSPGDDAVHEMPRSFQHTYSVALAKPECFLALLAAANWLTTQRLSSSWWPSAVVIIQLSLLWFTTRTRGLPRFSASLLPLQAVMMGGMFLFLDREVSHAGRSLLANNLALGTMLVIGFAPVSRRVKWEYAVAAAASLVLAAYWFNRIELIAAGVTLGTTLGLLVMVAFRSRRGQQFRIRFPLSVATVMTAAMIGVGYETFTGLLLFSDIAAHRTLERELPALQRILRGALESDSPQASFLSEQIRLTQYNPALSGIVTAAANTPLGSFGEQGRDFRLAQASVIDRDTVCATFIPLGLRLALGRPLSLCEEFVDRYFGVPATFIAQRTSARTAAIERKQFELALAEALLLGSAFITLCVRTLGALLYRSFSAPLASLLRDVLAARSQSKQTQAAPRMASELLEIRTAFFEMVEHLRTKQDLVAEADRRLRELVEALLRAVEPFGQRLQQLLPECAKALRAGGSGLPTPLTQELLQIVDHELEVVDQLFLLTKLDLDEIQFARELLTLEELQWSVGTEHLVLRDGAHRTLRLAFEPDDEYFAIDPRYLLKLIQLCAEDLNNRLPPSSPILIAARRGERGLDFQIRSEEIQPLAEVDTDPTSIRVTLIRRLAAALGGSVELTATSFRLWIPTQQIGAS